VIRGTGWPTILDLAGGLNVHETGTPLTIIPAHMILEGNRPIETLAGVFFNQGAITNMVATLASMDIRELGTLLFPRAHASVI
jgi:hypothetical protein